MWVLIDNYDSFTYILHHYLLSLNSNVVVFRNDALSLEELKQLNPTRLIISPGPETPDKAGITIDAIRYFYNKIPILGICLGYQAIGIIEGAQLEKANKPMHGKVSVIKFIENNNLFTTGLNHNTLVMRYHSLVLKDWEKCNHLEPIALSAGDNELMVFVHKYLPIVGFQFHPESVLTENGMQWLINWDSYCNNFVATNENIVY